MTSFYESWKNLISNPFFYFISITLGLAFTVSFSFFNLVTAIIVSVITLLSTILISIFTAFVLKDKPDVIEYAKQIVKEGGNDSDALKILKKARKKANDSDEILRLDYGLGSIYCLMNQYQKSVDVLSKILENSNATWTWDGYFQLAKALSHTKGYFSDETLDAYINCVKYRKIFNIYGTDDIKTDILLCNNISEIYKVKKDYAASNSWFREEMRLRKNNCPPNIRNKIDNLFDKVTAFTKENNTENILRQYEEIAYLIEKYISTECDEYAIVQLKMGKLFLNGYNPPRYDFANDCFNKGLEIRKKYLSDLPKELFDTCSNTIMDIQKYCNIELKNIRKMFNQFSEIRQYCNMKNIEEKQKLINYRDPLLKKCEEVLPLFQAVFSEDSLELAEVYRIIGECYKWCPTSLTDINTGITYFEKVIKIWKKYPEDEYIQTRLAYLLVDLGGTYVMQKDYDTALLYRLDAYKTIKSIKNYNIEHVGMIEVSVKGTFERTAQSKEIDYESFLKMNGLSTVIETCHSYPIREGWQILKVKLKGVEKEYSWEMTGW